MLSFDECEVTLIFASNLSMFDPLIFLSPQKMEKKKKKKKQYGSSKL